MFANFQLAARYLHLSDKIIVLNSDGHIEMQGSYSELKRNQDFLTYTSTENTTSTDEETTQKAQAHSEESDDPNDEAPDNLMDLCRRTGDLRTYLYYFRVIGFSLWVAFILNQAASVFTDNFPQVWLNWWTRANGQQLSLYLSVYAVLALCSIVLLLSSIWIFCLAIMPRSAIRLHQRLLDAVVHAPLSFFASTDSGVTLNRFSQDISLIDMALPIALHGTVTALFDCIAKLALISTGSSNMAITIPFTIPAIYLIQDVYLKTSCQLRFLDLES